MIHSGMPNNRWLLSLLCLFHAIAHAQQSHDLRATPTTVAWGHDLSQAAPVLRIKPGDRVTVHWGTWLDPEEHLHEEAVNRGT